MERSVVGLSIGIRGNRGANIACPGPNTPPEGQSSATYKGAVKGLISLATGVHELCHAGDQPGGDSRLLGVHGCKAGGGGGGAYAGAGIFGAASSAAGPASSASSVIRYHPC
ncbi:hypothetical protein Tco_1184629 [Tanacetum coccineum]